MENLKTEEQLNGQASPKGGLVQGKKSSDAEKLPTSYIDIVAVNRNIDTKAYTLDIAFDSLDGREIRPMPRKCLTQKGIKELIEFGADVRDDNAAAILRKIHINEKKLSTNYVYEQIGWGEYDGRRIFKGHEAIGVDASYIGDLDLTPAGSPECQRQIIEDEVIGHAPLEFIFTVGLMAPVQNILGRLKAIETMIVHLDGESSSGKTTALTVALASAGYPGGRHPVSSSDDTSNSVVTKDGLMCTLNSTNNAVLNTLGGNYGIPRGMDELAMYADDDLDKLVYKIASGEDKRRLNRDSQRQPNSTWSTVVITTGEFSWLAKAKGNTGIAMRLLEFKLPAWTKSAENAERLKEGLLANYGWFLLPFVEYLMEIGDDAVVEIWEKWRVECLERNNSRDQYSARMATKLAIIMTTAELVNESLDFQINIEGIWNVLTDMEQQSMATRDIGQMAYEHLIEYAICNPDQFPAGNNIPTGEKKGWFSPGKNELLYFPNAFSQVLTDGGFLNIKTVTSKLIEKDYLNPDRDRPTRKRKAPWIGTPPRVFVLNVESSTPDEVSPLVESRRIDLDL